MRKLWLMFLTVMLVAGSAVTGMAEAEHFRGEGYVERSAKSLEEYKPQKVSKQRQFTGQPNITVNPLATNFPDISLYVNVQDSMGNQVRGLTSADFQVTEQSNFEPSPHPQTIIRVTESTGASAINVMLVMDVSGSMWGQRIEDARRAAINFVNSMNPNDRVGLVSFESFTKIERPMDWVTTDSTNSGVYDIIEKIDALYPGGMTAMFDGAYVGVESMTQESHPKAVILLGDGEENYSTSHSINDVIGLARNNNIPVYSIGFHVPDNSQAAQQLRQIAEDTGGKYYSGATLAEMQAIYAEIAGAVASQYIIEYTTHNANFDGSTRTVAVTTNNAAGNGTYVVNYRPHIELSNTTLDLSRTSQQPFTPLNISGTVVDKDGPEADMQCMLYYRPLNQPGFVSQQVMLMNTGGGNYSFNTQIPANSVQNPGVEYYLWATDGKAEVFSPFNYTVTPYAIAVSNSSPVITHTPVTTADLSKSIQISANVIDPDMNDWVEKVALYYRTADPRQKTAYQVVDMTSSGGSSYSGSIPGENVTDEGVDYFISAWDNQGSRADHGTSEDPHHVDVSASPVTGYGSILMNIEPMDARNAGAAWRRQGTMNWHDAWTPEANVPVGQYSIEFRDVAGFIKPANQDVTVLANETAIGMGQYTKGGGGSLLVNIEPLAARQDGAAWRRVGTQDWFDSWTPEANVPLGDHAVEFKQVDGWIAPDNQTVTVQANETAIALGQYMPGDPDEPEIVSRDWVTAFYVAYWNRAADPEGLDYWLDIIASGVMDEAAVAENFGLSQEAQDMYFYLRNPESASEADIQAFVRGVYRNLLNREPDQAGQDYWVDVLKRGASTPGVLIGNFINAAILQATMGNPVDWQIISHKIEVADYFTKRFESQGRVWNPATDLTKARTALNHVTHDPVSVDEAKARIDRDLP